MDPFKASMGMNKDEYAALRSQGMYDMSGAGDQNFYQNLPMSAGMGFGEVAMPGMSGMSTGFDNMLPPAEQNMNYYQEYCRLFIANVVLTTQMKELITEKNELLTRLADLEKRREKIGGYEGKSPDTDKKARIRRKATEIDRPFKCPITTCQKSYGAEGSLMQHVKLKHPELAQEPEWRAKILKGDEEENGDQQE